MTSTTRRPRAAVCLFISALVPVFIAGIAAVGARGLDDSSDLPGLEFVRAQQANSIALREYTWKKRSELSLKGEVKNVKLEQVRHDLEGRLQQTRIGGTPEPDADRFDPRAPRTGPVQRIVVAKKKEEFQTLMKSLGALAESYAHPPLEAMHALARQLAVARTAGAGPSAAPSGSPSASSSSSSLGLSVPLMHAQVRNVVVNGDSMTIWIDPVTHMLRRVEITSSFEGDPVEIATDYRSLSNGLTYQARSLLRYPHKQIAFTVENFDHQYVGGTR